MEKTKLNALIRSNEGNGLEGTIDFTAYYEFQEARFSCNLYSYQCNSVEVARKQIIQWAKDSGFTVDYDQEHDVYTVKVPAATLTVNKNVCIIQELRKFNDNMLSNFALKHTNIKHLEAFIAKFPQLFDIVKEDEQYIRANYELELTKKHKRTKLCSIRQMGIDVLIRKELDDSGYKYKISKNSTRVTVTIDTGNYRLDYPIVNSKVTKMDDVIAELRNIIDTVKALPKNVKFKCKRK